MNAWIVCRRELRVYFTSFIAYVLIGLFLLLVGYYFYSDLLFFWLFGGFVPLTGLWRYFFLDLRHVLFFVLPLVTMRLFSEEKKLGTIELLWTYPLRDRDILIGKFAAAVIFLIVMVAPTIVYAIAFYALRPFDLGPLVAAYLGLLLLGMACISCGLFASTLSENQVVSAMLTYGMLLLFWFVTWNEAIAREGILRVLKNLSIFDHFYNFTVGVIDTRDVVFFAAFVTFFLFLGLRSLQARNWRGVR